MTMLHKEVVNDSHWFFWLLGLLFIALKLCDVIDWSWWWVVLPLWLPMVVVLLIAAVAVSGHSFVEWAQKKK